MVSWQSGAVMLLSLAVKNMAGICHILYRLKKNDISQMAYGYKDPIAPNCGL